MGKYMLSYDGTVSLSSDLFYSTWFMTSPSQKKPSDEEKPLH